MAGDATDSEPVLYRRLHCIAVYVEFMSKERQPRVSDAPTGGYVPLPLFVLLVTALVLEFCHLADELTNEHSPRVRVGGRWLVVDEARVHWHTRVCHSADE